MEGDEETLSNLNKPSESEMEEEKLEIEDSKNAEIFLESGESNSNVIGERISSEAATDGGGEQDVLGNHEAAESPFVTEAVVVMAEEGVREVISRGIGDSQIEKEDEEGLGDGSVTASVSDTRDAELYSESQIDARQDEILEEPKLEIGAEEEFVPVIDSKLEEVVSDLDKERSFIGLPTCERDGEIPASGEVMESVNDEANREMERKICEGEKIEEMVGAETMENDLKMVMDDGDDEDKVESVAKYSEIGEADKFYDIVEEKLDQAIAEETPISEVEIKMKKITEVNANVVNAAEDEQVHELCGSMGYADADVRVNLAENNGVAAEESLISPQTVMGEDESMSMGYTDADVRDKLAENNEVAAEDSLISETMMEKYENMSMGYTDADVREKLSENNEVAAGDRLISETMMGKDENMSMGYIDTVVRDKLSENNEVAAEDSLISETRMGEDENMSMENAKDFKLDEPVRVTEYRDEAEVDEELLDGNIREEPMELELTRNYVADEVQLEDNEVETAMESKVVADKTPGEDTLMETEETSSGVKDAGQEMDDSSAALQDEMDEKTEVTGTQDTEIETETEVAESGKASGGKRKRGKFSKSPSTSKATAKGSTRKTVGEDVCFICFDGGELVLCDRRGCPKAYHPSCVNRDEAFFKAKGRWNCGWHMCSICEKNALFMCYTCTFSLCKSCSKDVVIFCVRGNKGFCETCMRTVMLIEKNEHGNKDHPVDFDDRGSWEYLFKDYYIELKSKLSLSSVEVSEAKHPWKGASMMSDPSKQESSEAQPGMNDGGSCSDDSIENLNIIKPKRRKLRKQTKSLVKEKEFASASVATGDKILLLSDNSEWASKELLAFVSHMKNGDISMLSQFDVQGLLLEYIKRNKLRDPRRKSQIICDARLEILFGKPRVGHFEMLKLLESHFLVKDEQNEDVQESIVDIENNQIDVDDNADHLTKGIKDRKRKTRKKGSRGPQSNLDDYAAIDMHNISLIYLRRKLVEDLLEDVENFHDKVLGMFVRIRILGSLQKQDLYRLVQVVGTSKAAEPYKIGKKTTDIVMEILNLDKTEVISIDTISNQEFTEEECKRLRQSIKCGLISRLTVGEILDKTMEIQAARVDDWLESEIVRLSHLRDRASDIGRRKELRECVEKLQILKTPEERQRRLQEIPEIHSDPKMDPNYESDENDRETEDSRRDDFIRSRGSGFSRRGRGSIYPEGDNSVKDSWGSTAKISSKNWEFSRNMSGNSAVSGDTNIFNSESDRYPQESNNLEKLSSANSESADKGMGAASRAELLPVVPSVASQSSLPAGVVENSIKINEAEKMWHYQDPAGKVQGPFSMVQLRKWSNTGYFPSDLKIWRTSETRDDSILISDALAGKFRKELPAVNDIFSATDTPRTTILAGHSGQTSGISLHQGRERSSVDQNSRYHTKLSTEKWTGNAVINLPSPTPKQSIAGRIAGEGGILTGVIPSPGVKGVASSSTAISPNIETQSFTPHASVLNSLVQSSTAAFSPTSKVQQGIPVSSADSLHIQPSVTSEPHVVQMHGHPSTPVQPTQHVINQNPLTETQGWGSSAQPVQPQGYGWAAPNIQNSAASTLQSEFWRTTQGNQPNVYPPTAPNMNWGVAPAENNTPLGVRPENPNTGWGMVHAIPNMGFGNPAPGNANMNRGTPILAPPIGNANPSWVAPSGNLAANAQGPTPGNANSSWAATPGWVAPPVQGPISGNEWGPVNGNARAPAPAQGSVQGTTNQAWGAPQGNQGSPWPGKQNQGGGQFSGQMNGQGRDSGFGGGRPWNNQSSFVGGGPGGYRPFSRRDVLCPYNTNGRCRKGVHCDYLHA